MMEKAFEFARDIKTIIGVVIAFELYKTVYGMAVPAAAYVGTTPAAFNALMVGYFLAVCGLCYLAYKEIRAARWVLGIYIGFCGFVSIFSAPFAMSLREILGALSYPIGFYLVFAALSLTIFHGKSAGKALNGKRAGTAA